MASGETILLKRDGYYARRADSAQHAEAHGPSTGFARSTPNEPVGRPGDYEARERTKEEVFSCSRYREGLSIRCKARNRSAQRASAGSEKPRGAANRLAGTVRSLAARCSEGGFWEEARPSALATMHASAGCARALGVGLRVARVGA